MIHVHCVMETLAELHRINTAQYIIKNNVINQLCAVYVCEAYMVNNSVYVDNYPQLTLCISLLRNPQVCILMCVLHKIYPQFTGIHRS